MNLTGQPITRKQLLEQHLKQSIDSKKTKKRKDKLSKLSGIKIKEKSQGLIDAISKGAKEGERLAKDVTRKIGPEKGLAGTLRDTGKLGKEVKEKINKDRKELVEKYEKELKDAKDKCLKFRKKQEELSRKQQKKGMELKLDNMEIKMYEDKATEWCERYASLKESFEIFQKKSQDVRDRECQKDNMPYENDELGCDDGYFCKI